MKLLCTSAALMAEAAAELVASHEPTQQESHSEHLAAARVVKLAKRPIQQPLGTS